MLRCNYRHLIYCVAITTLSALSHTPAAEPKLAISDITADRQVYPKVPDSVLQLRRNTCSICHILPPPDSMPKSDWERVIFEMMAHLQKQKIRLTNHQIAQLQHFYQSFSPEQLPFLPDDFLPPRLVFKKHPIGNPAAHPRPRIADVNITDLNQDGKADIIICDDLRGTVSWIPYQNKSSAPLSHPEEIEIAKILAPVNSEVFDFDGDGDLDIAISSIGSIYPNDLLIGEAILLINDGKQNFKKQVILSGTPRLSDMQPGDLDGDGDIDFGLAMFGWLDEGALGWLEQVDPQTFTLHTIAKINGVMNLELKDLDQDGKLDMIVLMSQQHEQILRYMNLGKGKFDPFLISPPQAPSHGTSSFQVIDLDQDNDLDILYTNGDLMDTSNSPKPYHGIQWLENTGSLQFVYHNIIRYHSCYQAVAADMDNDGDLDIVASNLYFDWLTHDMPSLIWLENDGKQNFTHRRIAYSPSNLITIDVADLDQDGLPDIIAGGMHISGPIGRTARITLWKNQGPTPKMPNK